MNKRVAAGAILGGEAKGAHEGEDDDDDQDEADDADAAVAISVSVAPIREDAAASQSAEQEQEKDADRRNPTSDTAPAAGNSKNSTPRRRPLSGGGRYGGCDRKKGRSHRN